MVINGRTDMACEARSIYEQSCADLTALSGVRARSYELMDFPVTEVEILDDAGAKALSKARGLYYSIGPLRLSGRGDIRFSDAATALAKLMDKLIPADGSVLVAALGNPDITPDALGSIAAENIIVSRHLKERSPADFACFRSVAVCRPGVLGTSGVESAFHIKALCEKLEPSLVIAIDALAGADAENLCHTVQLCDSGISPGSGVGNDRMALNRDYLGVPVLSVGVPTVIDASSLTKDTAAASMFVTPRDIDSRVRSAGALIGYALNLALHKGLTLEDVDMLVN